MKGIQYFIRTEDVGWKKALQCKTIIKTKEIRFEYLTQKHEKSEFSNKFQTAFRNTYQHIFYITVFVI